MNHHSAHDSWTNDSDPLLSLSEVADHSAPPVDQVHRRASVIRQGRRRTRAGLSVGVVAAALVVGGVVIPQDDDGANRVQAASFLGVARADAADGADGDCRQGDNFTTRFTREQWTTSTQVAALSSWLPADSTGLPVRGIDVSSDQLVCPPPVPAATLYTQTPAKRGLTLWSDVAQPFAGDTGLENVTMRDSTAQLLHLPGNVMLTWVEPDGTRWIAQASGLDQASLVTILDNLTLDGTTVDGASVPSPWEQAPLSEPTDRSNVLNWAVEYGEPGDGTDDPGVRLHVTHETEPVATAAARGVDVINFTQVNGRLAISFTDMGGCIAWDSAGLAYQLCGSEDPDQLVSLAERVTRVEPTDPRVLAAPDLFETTLTGNAS
ncbi:hypothetical protein [Pengzhenrongella sicca]|uniref:Uncharacterized protein n=1 Tax=Pengzhenrongella sicca TaxID=2819238 RepID=A0A8A4ZH34_9MICO|nr:hypothetical protein [Pengzhenrongella sicca]QTE28948.1 hypothetical protein J4E96_16755 [Pengzhenrongella sicca]